jgi:hypothetical protein
MCGEKRIQDQQFVAVLQQEGANVSAGPSTKAV